MSVLISILILGFVIFIHELGHFLIAKLCKSPVYEFSVGIGTKIWSKKINGTEYCIRLIPLGGYVQLEEEEEVENGTSKYRELNVFKRIAICIAGVTFNFILAFIVILGISFASGYPSTTIGDMVNDSPAKISGLLPGDTVISINNNKVSSWDDIPSAVSSSNGKMLSFKINRNNEIKTIDVTPSLDEESQKYMIGVTPEYKKNFVKSFVNSIHSTVYNIKSTTMAYIDLFKGLVVKSYESDGQLTGPIGTIQVMSSYAEQGFIPMLMMVVSISISLGVANLLPIPALDGGRIIILLLEVIRGGKKLSIDKEAQVTMIGFGLLLLMMIGATVNDIVGLF